MKNFESMVTRLQRASSLVYEEETKSGSGAGSGRSVTPPARGFRAVGGFGSTPPSRSIGVASPGLGSTSMMFSVTSPGGGGCYQNPPLLTSQAIAAGQAVNVASCVYSTNSLGRIGTNRHRRATDSDMRSLADLTKDYQVTRVLIFKMVVSFDQ